MANTTELKQQISQGIYDAAFTKLYGADAELLEAILREQSRNGTIPPTSKLFRSDAVDNPPRTVV